MTAPSLRGTYAVRITGEGGRAPFAAIGLLRFDRTGAVSGRFHENRAGAVFDERVALERAYEGRVEQGADGLGTITADGGQEPDAFVAVRACDPRDPAAPAQEIALIFRDLDPSTGALRAGEGRRLPDGARFGLDSLSGRYTGFGIGRGGQAPIAGFGVLAYDGAGGFAEANVANVQGESVMVRRFVRGTDEGRYEVDAEGMGTVAGGGVRFVITRAAAVGGLYRAEEYAFVVAAAVPANGAHFTGIVRRIAD